MLTKNAFVREKVQAARNQYRRNVNDPANEMFGTNEGLQAEENSLGFLQGNNYYNALQNIQSRQVMKNSFKQEAVQQILTALKNTALAENNRIYSETKNVLLSENKNHRQTVLKIAALDDLMIEERKKLVTASTDNAAEEAAGRLYEIEKLKEELDEARHQSRKPTPDQEARYTALLAGVNFNALNTSIYTRLVKNNSERTMKNTAATKIQSVARGMQSRKKANILRRLRQASTSDMGPMIPMESIAPAPAPAAAPVAPRMTPAEMRAARLAALNRKKGGKRRTMKRKN